MGNRYFVLDNDIDLVDEWVPIDQFMGTFDGQGYSVNNLYVLENSRRENAGLFGTVRSGGVIKNVGVNINSEGLTATFFAGGLVGSSGAISVVNCYVTGNILGTGHVNAAGV